MYTGLLHLHSLMGKLLPLVLLATVLYFALAHFQKKPFTKASKGLGLTSLIWTHSQLVVGLILYFISPIVQGALGDMGAAMKDAQLRYWSVEHISTMILAIICITLGYSLSKRAATDAAKNQKAFLFYSIGLVLVLIRFPWDRL
jgi:phosphotransferase system  glucose/maltose/N-acetylglucosamine-specific IIC component